MADIYQGGVALGDLLAGGAARRGMQVGIQQGVDLQTRAAQGGLYSAQTHDALEKARASRNQNQWGEQVAGTPASAFADPSTVPLGLLIAGGMGGDFSSAQTGLTTLRDRNLGDVLADASKLGSAEQTAAQQGLSGKLAAPIEVPQQYAVAPGAPSLNVQTSPLGQAEIAKRNAEAAKAATTASGTLFKTSAGVAYQSNDGGTTWTAIGDPSVIAANAAARAGGAATGTKQAGLEGSLNTLNEFRTLITNLAGDEQNGIPRHGGFNTIYGMSSLLAPTNYLRGTEAQGAKALREQMASRAFLSSIQQMKGMGALSNAEGAKVETALTRALQPGLSEADAMQAFADLRTSLDNLERVARQEAAAVPSAIQTPNQVAAAPAAPPSGGGRGNGPPPVVLNSFATEAEAEAAAAAGRLRPGTRISVGGVSGVWQ